MWRPIMVQVDGARTELDAVATSLHELFYQPQLEGQPAMKKPRMVHDRINNAVWLYLPKKSPVRLTGVNQPAGPHSCTLSYSSRCCS